MEKRHARRPVRVHSPVQRRAAARHVRGRAGSDLGRQYHAEWRDTDLPVASLVALCVHCVTIGGIAGAAAPACAPCAPATAAAPIVPSSTSASSAVPVATYAALTESARDSTAVASSAARATAELCATSTWSSANCI